MDPTNSNFSDEALSFLVRLEWLHKNGEWLPRLPGDSKTHGEFTTSELAVLKNVAHAFFSIYGKDAGK